MVIISREGEVLCCRQLREILSHLEVLLLSFQEIFCKLHLILPVMDNLPGRKLPNLREVIKGSVFLHPLFREAFCPFWDARGSTDSSSTCPKNPLGRQISALKIPGQLFWRACRCVTRQQALGILPFNSICDSVQYLLLFLPVLLKIEITLNLI